MKNLPYLLIGILTGVIAYHLGSGERPTTSTPEWECYSALWGDADAMRSLGLDGMSAREVHAYCVEQINQAEPTLMVLSTHETPESLEAHGSPCDEDDCGDYDAGCLDNEPPSWMSEEIPATPRRPNSL
jgi:hypothetical protein